MAAEPLASSLQVAPGARINLVVPLEYTARPAEVCQELKDAGWQLDRTRLVRLLMPAIASQVCTDERDAVDPTLPEPLISCHVPGGAEPDRRLQLVRGDRTFRIADQRLFVCRSGLAFIALRVLAEATEVAAWQDVLFRLTEWSDRIKVRTEDGETVAWTAVVEDLVRSAAPSLHIDSGLPQPVPMSYIVIESGGSDPFTDLYRLRRRFDSGRAVLARSLDDDLWPPPLPYGGGLAFHLSSEGGGLFGADAPPTEFFRTTFPDHVDQSYTLALLIALLQRRALLKISQEVVHAGTSPPDHARLSVSLTDIRRDLLEIVSRSRFAQILPSANHHRVYRHMLDAFEVERLEREVLEEVTELSEFHRQLLVEEQLEHDRREAQARHQADLEQEVRDRAAYDALQVYNDRVAGAGLLIGVLGGGVTYLGVTVDPTGVPANVVHLALATLLTVMAATATWLLFGMRKRKPRASGSSQPANRPTDVGLGGADDE